jgi:integrase
MTEESIKELEPLSALFFERARSINDTPRKKFQAEYGISKSEANRVFPRNSWRALQDKWMLMRISPAMDEVFNSSIVREQFTVVAILKLIRETEIARIRFLKVAGAEWRARRMQLPTVREKVLISIRELVAKQIPADKLTIKLILENAGVGSNQSPWFSKAVLAARQKLLECRTGDDEVGPPPEGVRALTLPGGWVDMDSDAWDLRPWSGVHMRRDLIRWDMADIAWSQMRDALLVDHLTCGSVKGHYLGYRWAGELLAKEVPDVRKATLRRVQSAWLKYDARPANVEGARAALRRIFAHLCNPDVETLGVDKKEMLLISAWLYTSATVQFESQEQDFLSDSEMSAVIARCLADVKSGLDFMETGPNLLRLSTKYTARENALPVVHWGSSLMLLLMLFTGLRNQSVLNLRVGDWAEIRPGLFSLIWSHGKKREEKVAILAASVALLIEQYVERTSAVRQALRTNKVFLGRNLSGYWSVSLGTHYFGECFKGFVKRHQLRRGDAPMKLTCLTLRRTYVTRELYKGRSIWALRLQLGHETLRSTRRYGKFDQFEHPAEVANALDEHGRRALTLWRHPLRLEDLEAVERGRLLGVKEGRHQDVGLCRFDRCHKLTGGGPPAMFFVRASGYRAGVCGRMGCGR